MEIQTDPWYMARTIVDAYVKTYPELWYLHLKDMEGYRSSLLDPKYGQTGLALSNSNYQTRARAVFPSDPEGNSIVEQIEKFYPDLLKNKKKFREFLREFPVFSTSEKQ